MDRWVVWLVVAAGVIGCGGAEFSLGNVADGGASTLPIPMSDPVSTGTVSQSDATPNSMLIQDAQAAEAWQVSFPANGTPARTDSGCVPHCSQGVTCGVSSDGCGGLMQCGTCAGQQTCGGGGKPGQCGCAPIACVAGQTCGMVPDNCGAMEACGACNSTALCSGGTCHQVTMYSPACTPCQVVLAGPTTCSQMISDWSSAGKSGIEVTITTAAGSIGFYICPATIVLPQDACVKRMPSPGQFGYDCYGGA